VPSVAGLIIAGEVVRDLINLKIDQKDLKASI
jgi:tRNA A37 threonylcarbamoyladenosine dehydratase